MFKVFTLSAIAAAMALTMSSAAEARKRVAGPAPAVVYGQPYGAGVWVPGRGFAPVRARYYALEENRERLTCDTTAVRPRHSYGARYQGNPACW